MLDADDPVTIQDLRSERALACDRCSLVQRIIACAQRFDDGFKVAAALDIDDTVSVLAKHQCGMNINAVRASVLGKYHRVSGKRSGCGQFDRLGCRSIRTAGSQRVFRCSDLDLVAAGGEVCDLFVRGIVLENEVRAGRSVRIDLVVDGLFEDFRLRGLDEYNAEHASDLAAVDRFLVAVVGNILPCGIALQVIDRVRRYDSDEVFLAALTRELTRFLFLQGTDSFANFRESEDLGSVKRDAVCLIVGILDIGAGSHLIADDPVDSGSDLLAQKVGAALDNFVIGSGLQEIGYLDIRAVLMNRGFNIALRQ